MKKVLVIGSTGAMGKYVTLDLLEHGFHVTGLSLDDETPRNENHVCIKGNAKDRQFITELLKERFDGIVNFMSYPKTTFADWYPLFLDNTDHYIFLSSCRVYADEEVPVRETSPRLLDVSTDEALLASHDYCMHKARSENMLWASDYNNFTIVRPATILSDICFKVVTLEAESTIGRARQGKKVVLPIQAKDKPATLSWGGDVGRMIARLLFKPEAMREAYNVCSAESQTWGTIADYYKELCGMETVWVDKEDYLRILSKDGKTIDNGTRWQLEYARLFRRITDNSKVLKVTGMKQEDCRPLYESLRLMVEALPEDCCLEEGFDYVNKNMDAYLEEHGL